MAKRPKRFEDSRLEEMYRDLEAIRDYIDCLEEKIVEQGKVIDKYKERDRLTELWAKGEIEN
jgi:hypothetical protein|tara:strand:- start:242 stop:427 length:186 start_codon:yes stop_codon:yes gene_type:complete